MVGAVVFDLDGTLVDSMAAAPRAYVDTVAALGGPSLTTGDVVAVWHMGPTPVVLDHFLGRPVTPDDVERFHLISAALFAEVSAFPGVVDLLTALARAGCPVGIFTTANRRSAAMILEAAGLATSFEVVVAGDDVTEPKPAAEGLVLACKRLGVPVTETAYVGDAAVDLACAAAAGATGVHAAWDGGLLDGDHLVARHPLDVVAVLGLRVVR